MVGRLYHFGAKSTRLRSTELIEAFEVGAAQHRAVKGPSGGMRRRIDLAGAVCAKPRVLFLDEPTTGLDPRSRRGMWDVITNLVAQGTTVLLTTQYLEEADQLSDDISGIDGGKVIAQGTADELKAQFGGQQVKLTLIDATDQGVAARLLKYHGNAAVQVAGDGRNLSVVVQEGPRTLESVLHDVDAQNVRLHDAGMHRPTLDDVFLRLTGRPTEDGVSYDSPSESPGES